MQGIRRDESIKRTARYKEPIICRNYSKSDHVNVYLPILDWSDKDVADFINAHGIKCHPLYYNEQGKFCVERRLGCMGCPLASDRGLSYFKRYPKMARQWIKAGQRFLDEPPNCKTADYHRDGYAYFAHHVFFDSLDDFKTIEHGNLFGKEDWKQRLEDYFKIEL